MDLSGKIELPSAFEDADIDDLVILIADMLDRLVEHNDKIPLSPCVSSATAAAGAQAVDVDAQVAEGSHREALTRFHSRSPPSICILDYLRRIVKYANVERICILITLHYIDQICARMPNFTLSSLTCHRFVITAVVVSSKALCDAFCTNAHYAKVGGIRVGELNLLERELLAALDWRLTSTREVLDAYYVNLIRTHGSGAYVLAAPPPAVAAPPAVAVGAGTSAALSPELEELEPFSAESDMDSVRSISPAHVHDVGMPEEDTNGFSNSNSLHVEPSLALGAIASRRKAEGSGSLSGGVEPSAVLIDRATLSPKPVTGPTFEQNMAFAALRAPSTASGSAASGPANGSGHTPAPASVPTSASTSPARVHSTPSSVSTSAAAGTGGGENAALGLSPALSSNEGTSFAHDGSLKYVLKSPASPFPLKRVGVLGAEAGADANALRPRTRPRIELES